MISMSSFRTRIADVPVAELARRFGTPTFVYDAAMIRRRIADLAAFDVVRYAQKACSNLAILDLVRRSGALVDTVSAGEIRRAMAAGFPPAGDPPPIVYTADIFDAESLDLCVGTTHPRQLRLAGHDRPISAAARRGENITLRINPGFGHGHSQKTNTGGKQSKHGIWHTQIAECLDRAEPPPPFRHRPAHSHRLGHRHGTSRAGVRRDGAGGIAKLGRRCFRSASAAGCPPSIAPRTRYVDLAAYFALWDAARRRLEKRFGHAIRLEIEPGRYLVAESGYLMAEIRAVKRQDENLFYLLDAGFNNLARPILYGAYHPMSIVPADGEHTAAGARRDRRRAVVRVGRHLHPGGRRFRLHPPAARGEGRRFSGHRVRRRLRIRDGLELQQPAAGGRGADRRRPRRISSAAGRRSRIWSAGKRFRRIVRNRIERGG